MLKVDNLHVFIEEKEILKGISFQVPEGSITAVVGESGSGKTMTALSLMELLPRGAKAEGELLLEGENIGRARENYDISMIFQEPMTSLNPLMKVGRQLEEVLILHTNLEKEERRKCVYDMLARVELPNPEVLYHKYPHELSGGMRQRVMIAIAMICSPKLLIADEPTTALDPIVQGQIMALIRKLHETEKMTMLFITHNLNLVKTMADYIIVMKDGVIVEQGRSEDIFARPKEEYTKELLAAMPTGKKRSTLSKKDPIVKVKDVSLYYKEHHKKKVVSEHNFFEIYRGEILGLVGKSGCGKTSLARAIAGLNKGYDGEIEKNYNHLAMVFQDPLSSLNPSKTVGWIIEEHLRMGKKCGKEERGQRVEEMLYRVGLSPEYKDRYPAELSGGQRQRVSIAAALVGDTDFLVADEAVSALDVTVQAQILELLLKLQKEMGLTILFISHDMNVVDKICDRIIEI